ncbi:MAG: hypothetical protein Q8K75_00355 [Chlamydiales bacterium]|nr:hypothetical protein [Chlamydiales bacterium]
MTPLTFDRNHAKKMVGSVHVWDKWYIGRRWYHSATRSGCASVALPWMLIKHTLMTLWVLGVHSPRHRLRDQIRLLGRVCSLSSYRARAAVINSFWGVLPCGQLTTSWNGSHICNDDLYMTKNATITPHHKYPWGLFSLGWLDKTISFENKFGECNGQSLLFAKLFFELEEAIPDAEMRAYKISQLFTDGSPREATLLQGWTEAIQARRLFVLFKLFHPRTVLNLIVPAIVGVCAKKRYFGMCTTNWLPRGTLFGLGGLTRISAEYTRWRDSIILPYLGLAEANIRTTPNHQWVVRKYGVCPKQHVNPLPKAWQNVEPGIYTLNLTHSLLMGDKDSYGHSMLYIKISDESGLVFDPNRGLKRYTGKDHLQKISPMYKSIMPEVFLSKLVRKGWLNGSGLLNTLSWIGRG